MKVGTSVIKDSSVGAESRGAAKKKKSDSFSRLVQEQKNRENLRRASAEKRQRDAQNSPQNIQSGAAGSSPDAASLVASAKARDQIARNGDPANTPQAGSTTAAQIDKLPSEMGAQLELLQQKDGGQAFQISFDSRTLEGLQVQIQQQAAGEMSIHFVTQSPHVAGLLKAHVNELREALNSKGVKVGSIAVANTPRQMPPRSDQRA